MLVVIALIMLTMQFSQLATDRQTTANGTISLKIHGEQTGVKKATSEFLLPKMDRAFAVSISLLSM